MNQFTKFLLIIAILCVLSVAVVIINCGDDDDDDDDSSGDDDDDNDTTGDDDDDNDDDDTVSSDVWSDDNSGLMWTKAVEQEITWENAAAFCDSLILAGHEDWRLPTVSELRSLLRNCSVTMTGGDCGVTDECLESTCMNTECQGCDQGGGPNEGCFWPADLTGSCNWLWTSSELSDETSRVWIVNFLFGMVSTSQKIYDDGGVRCVR